MRIRPTKHRKANFLKKTAAAAVAVLATAAFSMTAPAAAHTPVTTKQLAAITTCMTAHQAWVWEKAVVSVPAIVLIPPRICPA
jgi:hypothetical protein